MIDVDTMAEVYRIMKEYIPSNEMQAIADHLISVVADTAITEKELHEFGETDGYLRRATNEYIGEDDESDIIEYDE